MQDPDGKTGDWIARIKWVGYLEQTWEPLSHIPRLKGLHYYERKKCELPRNIDETTRMMTNDIQNYIVLATVVLV